MITGWCVGFVLLTWNLGAHAASFDCKKAATKVEKMICANEDLGDWDETLDEVYKEALAVAPDKEGFKKHQQFWLRKVRNACKDEWCLELEYSERVVQLQSTIAAAEVRKKGWDKPDPEAGPGNLKKWLAKRFVSPQEERERLIAVAKKVKWEPRPIGEDYSKKLREETRQENKLSEKLLTDLQAGRFEIIPPLVRTDDYNDPKLQKYLEACPRLHPYKEAYFDDHHRAKWLEMLPERDQEFEKTIYYYLLDFRLYEVKDASGKKVISLHTAGDDVAPGNLPFGQNWEEQGPGYFSKNVFIDTKTCSWDEAQVMNTMTKSNGPLPVINGFYNWNKGDYLYEASYDTRERLYHLRILDNKTGRWGHFFTYFSERGVE